MRRRRGTILVVTMILVFAIAAMTIALAGAMRGEAQAAANAAAGREAGLVARGAEQYVLALLAQTDEPVGAMAATLFERVPLGSGYFWIVRPDYADAALPAFGLVDETAKLDLNTASYERLLLLPGMTEALAAAIVDWRDADDTPTEGVGAESPTYLARSPGHAAKNAPFESVEELLLVEGMTPELLYGPPAPPPLGQPGAGAAGTPLFGGELYRVRGFADLLTVWSVAPSTAPDGRARVNTAGPAQALRELLIEIIGGSRGAELAGRIGGPPGGRASVLALAVGAGMSVDEVRQLEPYLISGEAPAATRGRVNINAAPREVLLTVPGLDAAQVDALLAARPAATAAYPASTAWVLGVLGPAAAVVTDAVAGGAAYSADVVAVSGNGRAFRRVRVVVDISGDSPRIVYRRDLTAGGWPLDPQILAGLRAGER